MVKVNNNFLKLQDSYLFSTIAKKVKAYQKEHPDKKIIKQIKHSWQYITFGRQSNGTFW